LDKALSVKLSNTIIGIVAAAFFAASTPLSAHIYYTGRDFGSFTATGTTTSVLIASNSVAGDFGWASGTDSNLGDSHKLTAFKFTLLNTGMVTFDVQGLSFKRGILNLAALAMPGFSIYKGLAHEAPLQPDHDFSTISSAYNDATYGVGNWEGSFNALSNWKIGSDDGVTFADLSSFEYKCNAADGTSSNYGNATGIYGDGMADGEVRASFLLGPGNYSIFVGGANYSGTSSASFGFNSMLSVIAIPEPATYALFAFGIIVMFGFRSRWTY
jgi:hypothetical protein